MLLTHKTAVHLDACWNCFIVLLSSKQGDLTHEEEKAMELLDRLTAI